MINNVNRTFTTTPLLVIYGHLLNIFVLVDILAEGESATFGFLSLANAGIAKLVDQMHPLLYPQMIGLDEQIFYSHNRNDEPSETEHAEMRFNLNLLL